MILLVGNPNAGKSTLFNLLTGGHAKVGNWHGVTVGALEGRARIGGKEIAVCDLPGIYSLESMSMEETFTRDFLAAHGEDFLLFVAECANLERALPLIRALCAKPRRAALVLTKEKRFRAGGGRIGDLSGAVGLPVFSSDGKKKKELLQFLGEALRAPARVAAPASLPPDVYRPAREGLSRADKILCNGWLALPLFFGALLLAFLVTFASGFPGDFLKGAVERFFTEYLAEKTASVSSPVLRSFLKDGLLSGLGGVLCFLPQIALLFFFLILLEESGFMSRLAMLSEGFFSRLGLNGRAAFSLLMGFGCTAAAILTTRGFDEKRVQKRVVLLLPYISCSAKLPVFLTLSASFFPEPFLAVVLLYLLGVGISFAAALLMKGGETPFVLELAPLQVPSPVFVAKALLFQLKQFIIKVATVVLAFFLLSWLLSSFDLSFALCDVENSMLAALCGRLDWLFAPIGLRDWRVAYAALSGLIAKENVAGALSMFYGGFPFPAESAFSFAVFLLCCSPCVSAIAACARELGWKFALLAAAGQTVSALLLSYAVYFCLTGGIGSAVFVAVAGFAACFVGKNIEKVYRGRGKLAQKIHRQRLRAGVLLPPHPAEGKSGQGQRRARERGCAASGGRRGDLLPDARAGEQEGIFRRLRGRKRHDRR